MILLRPSNTLSGTKHLMKIYNVMLHLFTQDLMNCLSDVLFCTNPLCQEHKSAMDRYCQSICDCLVESAKMCIPITTVCKRVAGWNVSACLLKRQASFWHQLWVDCGSPSAGVAAEIKKKTKQKYKAETRRLKR